jgi:geranylgeranyl reductase family protein
MTRQDYDVIVVGGGPAGSSAARVAAENGVSVLLLEEHTKIGRPIQCTGLLSLHGIESTKTRKDIQLRPITGVYVYSPDGTRIKLGGQKLQAQVIDRDRLDQQLVQDAESAGVEVRSGIKVTGWESGNIHAIAPATGETFTFSTPLVIGADGAHSRVAQWAKLPRPTKQVYGVQVLVPHKPEREDFVEVFIGRQIAPNFFAWAVPAGDNTARVGLASDTVKEGRATLDRLLEERYSPDVINRQGGTIPFGLPDQTVADGVMLVGDAAGQAKPTSGGGIYTSSVCGMIAGEVAAQAVKQNDFSRAFLNQYEQRWRDKLERELQFGWHAHRLLCHLSDDQINRVFEWLSKIEVQSILEEYGDIDYPSVCMKEIVKRPSLWKDLLSVIPKGSFVKAALNLTPSNQ